MWILYKNEAYPKENRAFWLSMVNMFSALMMVENAVHELTDTADKEQSEPEKIVNVSALLDELNQFLAQLLEE